MTTPSTPGLWWLSPAIIPLVVAAAAIVPTSLVDDQRFRTSWRTPRSVTTETLQMFGCGAATLAFGALIGIVLAGSRVHRRTTPWPGLDVGTVHFLSRATTILTVITVCGYVGFALLILRAGITPAELFGGVPDDGSSPIKDRIGTIPGVTTLTQFGVATVVVSTTTLVQRFSWSETAKVAVVVLLAVPRAYINSERLALLELVVPIAVIVATRWSTSRGASRFVAQTIPVFGMAVVVLTFGLFEYFRSWSFYRAHGSTSFVDFALTRFAGYYATSLNNGQLILTYLRWPNRWPYDTLEGFWTAPGIETLGLYEKISGHPPPYNRTDVSPYFDVLRHYANPEFNNPSGYAAPFVDYGLVGGLVFLFLVGMGAGALYELFTAGRPFALLVYPVAFVGLVEMPRYLYWVQGRAAYTWIALVAIAILLARRARRAEKAASFGVGITDDACASPNTEAEDDEPNRHHLRDHRHARDRMSEYGQQERGPAGQHVVAAGSTRRHETG